MAGLIGRTIASGDGIQTVSLIVTNDSGTYLYRRPQDLRAKDIPALVDYAAKDDFLKAAERMRVRISDKLLLIMVASGAQIPRSGHRPRHWLILPSAAEQS